MSRNEPKVPSRAVKPSVAEALCAALVLASFLGAFAQARSKFNTAEVWKTRKGCVGGEQSASSANPAWAAGTPRAGGL
jgi:hypothetical protein